MLVVDITKVNDNATQFDFPNGDMYLGTNNTLYIFPKGSQSYRKVDKWELYMLAARGVDKYVLARMAECIKE